MSENFVAALSVEERTPTHVIHQWLVSRDRRRPEHSVLIEVRTGPRADQVELIADFDSLPLDEAEVPHHLLLPGHLVCAGNALELEGQRDWVGEPLTPRDVRRDREDRGRIAAPRECDTTRAPL
jgi:hypothetical protein